jgi:hypothetical protein
VAIDRQTYYYVGFDQVGLPGPAAKPEVTLSNLEE